MSKYNNFLIADDFYSKTTETAASNFSYVYHQHNLAKDPTCYKYPNKPSYIDFTLTNFQNRL